MVKEIPLQNGMVALVDDEDYEKVCLRIWSLSTYKNALRVVSEKGGLGQYLLNVKNEEVIIHRNKNNLDFRKNNIFVGDPMAVAIRRKGVRDSSSKYKGVYWNKKSRKWIARIKKNGVGYHLGSFSNEDEAAKVYNDAAIKYFGKDAYQNIIGENNNSKPIEVSPTNSVQLRTITKTGYKGVSEHGNKYRAYITINRKTKYIGLFYKPEEAAKAYDKEARKLYGVKAILNFPDEYGMKVKCR